MSTEPFVPYTVNPVVHINGTSAEQLIELRSTVYDRLYEVSDALAQMAPNGRDYYPDGPSLFESANEQHARRLQAIRQLMDEMTAEIEHITEYAG